MKTNFFIQHKQYFIPILIVAPINALIFITPVWLSIITDQYLLLSYYLVLFFAATLSPSLLVFGLVKKHTQSLLLVSLLIISLVTINFSTTVLENNKTYSNFKSQVSKDTQLEIKNVKNQTDLLLNNFCFEVYLPEFLPAAPYEMKFRDAIGSGKECSNQIISILYVPYNMTILEVPRNYDFEFRQEFVDLKSLKEKALSGEKVDINGKVAYLSVIKDTGEGIVHSGGFLLDEPAKLLYLEMKDTLVFFKYAPNEHFGEEIYFKIAKSLKRVN